MRKNSILLSCFILISFFTHAQEFSKTLEGRVQSEDKDVADVHVLNITSKKATITDTDGYFSITAKLNDTLVFSAVQYKRKTLVVNASVLSSTLVYIPLEPFTNELDEVVVRPFDLSGDLERDMGNMQTGPVVSSSTLGLPNANVKPMMQSERLLRTAAGPKFHPLMILSPPVDPLINAITGRTKMLKKRVARDKKYARTERVRQLYADSLFTVQLKIPKDRIDDFMYFCEVDSAFSGIVDTHDRLKILEFMRRKSAVYRENNGLD